MHGWYSVSKTQNETVDNPCISTLYTDELGHLVLVSFELSKTFRHKIPCTPKGILYKHDSYRIRGFRTDAGR